MAQLIVKFIYFTFLKIKYLQTRYYIILSNIIYRIQFTDNIVPKTIGK